MSVPGHVPDLTLSLLASAGQGRQVRQVRKSGWVAGNAGRQGGRVEGESVSGQAGKQGGRVAGEQVDGQETQERR